MVGGYGSWSKRLTYNSLGLLYQAQDARGVVTTFAYDDLNRVQTVSYSDATPQVTYTYGTAQAQFNKGRLVSVETAAVTSTNTPYTKHAYTYNLMGRVSNQQQQVETNIFSLNYTYNGLGEVTSETYPAGRTINNVYDHAGRLTYVGDSTRSYAQSIGYEAFGGLKSETWGNYQAQSVTYNNRLQPTQVKLAASSVPNATVIQQYDYAYGQMDMTTGTLDTSKNTGQVAGVSAFIGASKQHEQQYGYDKLGRLNFVRELRGDNNQQVWQHTYTYDRYGNRYQAPTDQNVTTPGVPYTPVEAADINQATNRFQGTNPQTNQPFISYDAAGNMTSDVKFTFANYEYDANGRAKTVTAGGTPVKATYDALGQRVQSEYTYNNQTSTTRYVYDLSGNIIAEYEQGQLKRERVYRAGSLLATVEQATGGEQVSYVMSDHQGSTRVVTNQQGQVTSRHDYTPFGNEIGQGVGMRTTTQGYGQPSNVKQGYALTENDTANLKHTWFRKLDSKQGRFTSPDPYNGSMSIANPQSMNRYAYVENDPVNFVDPSGLLRIQECTRSWWTDSSGERHYSSWMCVTIYDDGGGRGELTGDRRRQYDDARDRVRDRLKNSDSCRKFLLEKLGLSAGAVTRAVNRQCAFDGTTSTIGAADAGLVPHFASSANTPVRDLFDRICEQHKIEHRLTKINHPWTNGQVERMNRTIKEATVKRYYYESHQQLKEHLSQFLMAYNFARRLKTLMGLTPYEHIFKCWQREPERFNLNPHHHNMGLNT